MSGLNDFLRDNPEYRKTTPPWILDKIDREEWVPKNKAQEEGFAIGKSFVQGFTDQIKERDTEIERLTKIIERKDRFIDQLLKDFSGAREGV